jgi:hypothetical protein
MLTKMWHWLSSSSFLAGGNVLLIFLPRRSHMPALARTD